MAAKGSRTCGCGVAITRYAERCKPCRDKAMVKVRPSATCPECGNVFTLAKDREVLCSAQCVRAQLKRIGFRKSAEDRFSSAHRRALQAVRRSFNPAGCQACGAWPMPRGRKSVCSPACDLAIARTRYAISIATRTATKQCIECGASFSTHRQLSCCSSRCTRRHSKRIDKQLRRARERKAPAEAVSAMRVFNRDGWVCYLCGIPTPRSLRGTHAPNAPELEHVVPLALGGHHTYANTRCACRQCNGAKGLNQQGLPGGVANGVGVIIASAGRLSAREVRFE